VFCSGDGGQAGEPGSATDWLGTALRFAAGPEPAPQPARESAAQSVPQPARESVAQPVPGPAAPSVPGPARESVAQPVHGPARDQQPERLPSRDR
jgi:hypothetical protein